MTHPSFATSVIHESTLKRDGFLSCAHMALCGCHVLHVYLFTSYNGCECTCTFLSPVPLSFPSSGEPYIQILLPMHPKNHKLFSTVSTMSYSRRVTKYSFTMCKNTMLKEAQTSIALLLQEIQTIGSPNIPSSKKIIQPKTPKKFVANREVRRTRVVGKNKEVTAETPSTKTAAPTPVSVEKRRKGGAVAKKRKKGVVLPTAASSRPPSATRQKTLH
jgi:hypothetical protein